jgi:AcrR family transcriptional regulator
VVKDMGRPREHDESTAATLLAAAERLLNDRDAAALSLREVASDAGTSTRAVYSVFGSKEGLLAALGAHAMELLFEAVDALPVTADPYHDLVEAALVFRRFALDHPALFEVAFQRLDPRVRPLFRATADEALSALTERFEPLATAGLLGTLSVPEAVMTFHGLCEGMAGCELRGFPPHNQGERLWASAFRALLTGFASPTP